MGKQTKDPDSDLGSRNPLTTEGAGTSPPAGGTEGRSPYKKKEEALVRSLRRFELLSSTAGELLQARKPQEAVESVCRRVMEFLDCHIFINFLADEDAGKLRLNAYAGLPEEEARRIEWREYGVAICGCAARDGRRIVAEHIPSTPDERTEFINSYGIKACAAHPLKGPGGKVLGTLFFGTLGRETFSEEELSLMNAVTDQVAMAMARIKDEEALLKSEERLRALVSASSDVLYRMNPDWSEIRQLSGGGFLSDILGPQPDWWRKYVHPDDRAHVAEVIREAIRTRSVFELEHRVWRSDGTLGWTFSRAVPMLDPDGRIVEWFGAAGDITERKRAEEALRASLEEKDILLRELSHRTKNNMQVIIGMLGLQASKSKDGNLAQALTNAQDRIRIMALVYAKLHRSGSVSSLNIKEYSENLVISFLNAHKGTHGPVRPVLELEDIEISHDQALPCGLIINELVSNSLKHAFTDGKTGNIFISLRPMGGKLELRYRDDGPGLPKDLDLSQVGSLGLKLVYNLAVRQLRGTLELVHGPGTEFVFQFPLSP